MVVVGKVGRVGKVVVVVEGGGLSDAVGGLMWLCRRMG